MQISFRLALVGCRVAEGVSRHHPPYTNTELADYLMKLMRFGKTLTPL